jgi:hypothetical protein
LFSSYLFYLAKGGKERFLNENEKISITLSNLKPLVEEKIGDVHMSTWHSYETDQYKSRTAIEEHLFFGASYLTPDAYFVSEKIHPVKFEIPRSDTDISVKSRLSYRPERFRSQDGSWYRGICLIEAILDSSNILGSSILELDLSTLADSAGNYVVRVLQPPMPNIKAANSSGGLTKVSVDDCNCLLIRTPVGRATISKDLKVLGFEWDGVEECCIQSLGFESRDDWQKQQFNVIEKLFRSLKQHGVLDPKNKNLFL